MTRISCRKLVKRFGETTVVDGLDLDIESNEFLTLLGPSGCGKTTTLNMIAGLEEISGGELYFGDRLMNAVPPHKREIAMVFQSYALYPQKTIFENIAFSLRLRRMADAEIRRRVGEVAEQLEIAHLLQRRPAALSGGQRQRVALGRAIVREPSVFLMDEPLSNLDAALRVTMRSLIKRLHQTMKATFVYVTHDQEEAMTMADRIVVMRDGRIQDMGSPNDIYHRPRNLYVASFLGRPQINTIEGQIERGAHGLVFVRGDLRVALPPKVREADAGRAVVLGIRPEDLALSSTGEIAARVELLSPLGSEQQVGVRVGDSELVLRAANDQTVVVGEQVRLQPGTARLQVFDRETGTSLSTADR